LIQTNISDQYEQSSTISRASAFVSAIAWEIQEGRIGFRFEQNSGVSFNFEVSVFLFLHLTTMFSRKRTTTANNIQEKVRGFDCHLARSEPIGQFRCVLTFLASSVQGTKSYLSESEHKMTEFE
jgi:hypothetical protein